MKKLLVILMTLVVALGAFVGCGGGGGGNTDKVDISGYIDDIKSGNTERLTISWMIPTQQSVLISQIPSIQAAAAKFNINLQITEDPIGIHNEKLTLGLSDQDLPDIISWVSAANAKGNGPLGAYIDLSLYEDEMVNFVAIRDEAIAFNQSNYNVLYNTSGSYYATPHYLSEPINLFDFSIVKSEFLRIKEQYDLIWTNPEEPTTWEEIEEVLVNYKTEYESSHSDKCYPLSFRNFQSMAKELQLFVESFSGGEASTLDYIAFDESRDEFVFAPEMDGYRQAVAHYADWFKKGLISPDKTIDSNAMNNMLINGDVIMIADYIGGMSGLNYIQRDIGYILYPLQIPQAQGQRRVLGRDLTNFDPLVGHALNGKLTKDPEKLARAIMFLDYLYSDEFVENLWYNDDVTTKNVTADKVDAPLSVRKDYFRWNNDSVYNTSKEYDYTTMNNTYFPWSLCCGFVDIQDERPNPNFECTAAYIDYRDNVLRAPYKEGYDASTSPYVYGKNPTVLLTAEEQKRVLHYEASITDIYKTNIAAFCEGKKNFESDWNEFINTMMQSGGEEMIQIYNNAYNRAE